MVQSKKKPATKKSKRGKNAKGVELRNKPLRELSEKALRKYFKDLNGTQPTNLYDFVIAEVEAPLLLTVMEYTDGNQIMASDILGINRATLRKKLRQHKLL